VIPIKENWEYTLQALETLLLKSDGLEKDVPKSKRLLWLVDVQKEQIQALEQIMQARGTWSKGRMRSWQTLKERDSADLTYLSQEDIKVIDEAVFVSENYWSRDTYDIHFPKAMLALIGHPHIAHKENPAIPIVLKATDPELFIDQKGENYFISLSHPRTEIGIILEVKSVSEYNVVYINQTYAALGQLLGKDGKSLPAHAKDKILTVIQHAKHDIKIHSSMSEVGIPEFASDPTPYMQLLPTTLGVRAMLLVKPLDKNETAYFRAAEGKENIIMLISEIDGDKRIRVNRNFEEEKQHVHTVLKQCSVLKHYESAPVEYEMESPEAVLEVLSALQEYAKTQPLVIEWPKGQSYKIKQRLATQQVAFKISSQANWFEYDGNLTLDDGAVLNLKEVKAQPLLPK
jgi:hypothetical protein